MQTLNALAVFAARTFYRPRTRGLILVGLVLLIPLPAMLSFIFFSSSLGLTRSVPMFFDRDSYLTLSIVGLVFVFEGYWAWLCFRADKQYWKRGAHFPTKNGVEARVILNLTRDEYLTFACVRGRRVLRVAAVILFATIHFSILGWYVWWTENIDMALGMAILPAIIYIPVLPSYFASRRNNRAFLLQTEFATRNRLSLEDLIRPEPASFLEQLTGRDTPYAKIIAETYDSPFDPKDGFYD